MTVVNNQTLGEGSGVVGKALQHTVTMPNSSYIGRLWALRRRLLFWFWTLWFAVRAVYLVVQYSQYQKQPNDGRVCNEVSKDD
jgi:hypothetical protein